MPESALSNSSALNRVSPLSGILSEKDSGSSLGQRVSASAREVTEFSLLVLRGDQTDPAFLDHTHQALDLALPLTPSVYSADSQQTVLWKSPDEWWILCSHENKLPLLQKLGQHSDNLFMQVLDNSGSLAALELTGANHLTVLRHLTPFDVQTMRDGACVSTAMAQTTLTLVRPDPTRVLMLFRRSYAAWVWQLVRRSARPYGLRVMVGNKPE